LWRSEAWASLRSSEYTCPSSTRAAPLLPVYDRRPAMSTLVALEQRRIGIIRSKINGEAQIVHGNHVKIRGRSGRQSFGPRAILDASCASRGFILYPSIRR
jgi:hypothetical protein